MHLNTELTMSCQTLPALPAGWSAACNAPAGALRGGCLAATVMLMARLASAQEALRNSTALQFSTEAPRLRPDSLPYTVKSGDFSLLVTPSLALDYNDNIRTSNSNPEDDFILRPALGLNLSYPITQRNLLLLNVSFGYSKYLRHDDLSTWFVQSGSQLSFDVFVKDFKINLHDQFSYIQDSAQEAAVANTGSYGTLNNTAGLLVNWNLQDLTPSLGYDHQIVKSTTPQFEQQDHSSESLVGRMGLRVYPGVTPGVEGTVSFTSYDQTVLNNNTAYSLGAYADWQPGPYLHLQARAGYSIFQFQHTSQSIQTGDLNSWYVGLTATHQLSDSVSYSLSAGHDIRLGIQSDAIEEYYFQPGINWSIIKNWTFQTFVSYQHGNQGQASLGGNSTETYDWISGGLGVSHAITARLTAALNYRLTWRSSNEASQEYTQNLVELQLTYRPQ